MSISFFLVELENQARGTRWRATIIDGRSLSAIRCLRRNDRFSSYLRGNQSRPWFVTDCLQRYFFILLLKFKDDCATVTETVLIIRIGQRVGVPGKNVADLYWADGDSVGN